MTSVTRRTRNAAPRASIEVAVESRVPQRVVSRARVCDIVRHALRHAGVTSATISVTFVSGRRIAQLHRSHLGKRGVTDVITLAFAPVASHAPLVADVYIAPDVARRNARSYGVSVREEIVRLLIHGALHAAGLEHSEAGDRTRSPMWRRQERLVRAARQ